LVKRTTLGLTGQLTTSITRPRRSACILAGSPVSRPLSAIPMIWPVPLRVTPAKVWSTGIRITSLARSLWSSGGAYGRIPTTPGRSASSAMVEEATVATSDSGSVDTTVPPAPRMRAATAFTLSPGKTETSICRVWSSSSSAATAARLSASRSRRAPARSCGDTFMAGRYGVTSSTHGSARTSSTRSGSIPTSRVKPARLLWTCAPTTSSARSHSGAGGPTSLTR
jgi:hypothetical protein